MKYKMFFVLLLILSFSYAFDYAYILKLSNTSVYPQIVYPNTVVSLNITLDNISYYTNAYDVNVYLLLNNNYFKPIKTTDFLKTVAYQTNATFSLRFKVKSNVSGGYYSIPFKVKYFKEGKEYTIDGQVSIKVKNYNKINVKINNYPNNIVYLGDIVNINGLVCNNGNNTLKGVSIKITANANYISLSDDDLFLSDILPNKCKPFNFKIKIPKSNSIGFFNLTLTAKDVNNVSATNNVSFVVDDKPRLIVSSVEKTPEKIYDDFSLAIQLENVSKTDIKNVFVEIQGNFFDGKTKAYVGPIDSDDSGSAVFDLSLKENTKEGKHILFAKIIYLDDYDNNYSYTIPVEIYVYHKEESNFYIYVFLLLVILFGYFIYKNKLKKKVKNI